MSMLGQQSIIKYLKANIHPVTDVYSKSAYRAAATLKDGTYLPCVVFRNKNDILDLAKKRFEELMNTEYKNAIIETFVVPGNRVAWYDLKSVDQSPFSLPGEFRDVIYNAGETRMGYQSFQADMADGAKFFFSSTTHVEFFEVPNNYTLENIVTVYTHRISEAESFREKPYFDCFIDGL